MLLPPTVVGLFSFIYRTALSAGSDLKTIIIIYDITSSQLASDILTNPEMHSLDVGWSTINVDTSVYIDMTSYDHNYDLQYDRTLIFAVLYDNPPNQIYKGFKILHINPFNSDIIFIYPYDISVDTVSDFLKQSQGLNMIFVNNLMKIYVRNNGQTLCLNEWQFANSIETYFYRTYRNMQLDSFRVLIVLDPPRTFNILKSSNHTDRLYSIGGVDIYLTELIAEHLNGTAHYIIRELVFNDTIVERDPTVFNYIQNKMLIPIKTPAAVPAVRNPVRLATEEEFFRFVFKQNLFNFIYLKYWKNCN